MSNNRRSHIIKLLETFDHEHLEYGRNIPLDVHTRKYFIFNKDVSNIDREFICDQVYNLISNTISSNRVQGTFRCYFHATS